MKRKDMAQQEETTLQRIERLSQCHPSECHCARCQQMCHVPCLGTPEDIEKLVDAGYADRLRPTEWLVASLIGLADGPISMIQPEVVDGWCTFYHNGLCELHDKGLKPTEGRLSRHDDVETHGKIPLENNVAFLVAKEWVEDKNFDTILRLCVKIKKAIKKMNTNILVTNYNNSGENVLIMTEEPLSALTVAFALTHKKQTFTEVYPIKDEERQYYCFDPLWMKKETVENTHRLAQEFTDANPKGSKLYEEIKRKCAL